MSLTILVRGISISASAVQLCFYWFTVLFTHALLHRKWLQIMGCQSQLSIKLTAFFQLEVFRKQCFICCFSSILYSAPVWGPWFTIFMGIPCYCLNHLYNLRYQSIMDTVLTMAIHILNLPYHILSQKMASTLWAFKGNKIDTQVTGGELSWKILNNLTTQFWTLCAILLSCQRHMK